VQTSIHNNIPLMIPELKYQIMPLPRMLLWPLPNLETEFRFLAMLQQPPLPKAINEPQLHLRPPIKFLLACIYLQTPHLLHFFQNHSEPT
jgi:hypothetical protein